MDELTITVSQLNEYIARRIYRDTLLQNIRVQGEITNFKLHASGSVYFSLKDSISAIPCVMFENTASLPPDISDGKKVTVVASVNFYAREGRLQLAVQKVELSGLGELYLKFEQIKKKLYDEGLFDAKYKKRLPLLPERLGVVTSASGAAIHDIIQVSKRRFPGIKIELFPAKVQGEGAPDEIIEGIEYFNRENSVDVIIVGRGGGSFEDLSAFNEESVARAIFASKIPIVSAVGHEIDLSIADFTADMRAPTPSAAAELCVPDIDIVIENLENIKNRLSALMQSMVAYDKSRLETARTRLMRLSPETKAAAMRSDLSSLRLSLQTAVFSFHAKKLAAFQTAKSVIAALNPYNVLKRGYAIVKNQGDKAVTSINSIQAGEHVQIIFLDGSASAKVEKIGVNGGAG